MPLNAPGWRAGDVLELDLHESTRLYGWGARVDIVFVLLENHVVGSSSRVLLLSGKVHMARAGEETRLNEFIERARRVA